jgi:hypothetical protein
MEFDLVDKELEAFIRGTNLLGQRTKVGRAGDTVIDMSSALLCSLLPLPESTLRALGIFL